MSNPADKALYRAAAVIFEEMGFLLPTPSDRPIGHSPAAGAIVSFRGPFAGALTLRITRDVLPILTSNMLGDERSENEQLERDAVGEIANVICGNVLPAIAGGDATFSLECPRFFEGQVPGDTLPARTPSAEIHVGLDPGQADIALYMPDGMTGSQDGIAG
jgi:CheY-specific phosphatase CheX